MQLPRLSYTYDVSSKKFKASSKSDSSIGEEEKPETPKKCTASNECACTGTCTLEELKTGISFSYDPGDGINHIFYLLNNSSSKIIAIMDRNITEGAKDESGNANAVIYQAEAKTLAESLKWNNVETVRLPKANEIAYIGCTDSSWNSATATTSNAFYFGTNNLSDTSKRNQYKWLYNYTRDCVNSDCDKSLNTPEASGYWTSDIVYGKTTHAWVVNDRGFLDYGNTTYANKPVGGGYGVRPVVEVSPSNLYQ